MSTPRIPLGDQDIADAQVPSVAGGSSPDEHLAGLPPELVARIREVAAELAATAPPLTKDQVKALSAIFRPTKPAKREAA